MDQIYEVLLLILAATETNTDDDFVALAKALQESL